jgi:hypothetical protein
MFDFEFEHIVHDQFDLVFDQGFYLWIFHADKIPPHIGVSFHGHFYSLKSSGADIDLDAAKVFRLIRDKKLSSFLIKLSKEFSKEDIERKFQKYSKAQAGSITCLTPVKEILGVEFVSKLSELLVELQKEQVLLDVYGYNLPSGLNGIRAYTTADITIRLLDLENKTK